MPVTVTSATLSTLTSLLEAEGPLNTQQVASRLGVCRRTVYAVLRQARRSQLIGQIVAPHPLWRPDHAVPGAPTKTWALARDLLSPQEMAALCTSRDQAQALARTQARESAQAAKEERRQQALRDKAAAAAQEAADQETAVFEALLDAPGPQTNPELAALCVLPEHVVADTLLRMLVRGEVRRLTPMTLGYPLRLESTNRHAWAITRCQAAPAAALSKQRAQP